MGMKVSRKTNEPVVFMLRRLKKMMEREGVFRHMRESAHYKKPSQKRREAEQRKLRNIKNPRPPKQPKPPVPKVIVG